MQTIVGDLERRLPAIKSTKSAAAEELQHETPENRDECKGVTGTLCLCNSYILIKLLMLLI